MVGPKYVYPRLLVFIREGMFWPRTWMLVPQKRWMVSFMENHMEHPNLIDLKQMIFLGVANYDLENLHDWGQF